METETIEYPSDNKKLTAKVSLEEGSFQLWIVLQGFPLS